MQYIPSVKLVPYKYTYLAVTSAHSNQTNIQETIYRQKYIMINNELSYL